MTFGPGPARVGAYCILVDVIPRNHKDMDEKGREESVNKWDMKMESPEVMMEK